jgi:anti-sigma factor RsiW
MTSRTEWTEGGGTRDPWVDRLSEYVDGDLAAAERWPLEHHLAECADCAALVEELRAVAARGREMCVDVEPASDLWPGIVSRHRTQRRTATGGWARIADRLGAWAPQLAAAAIVLIACVAGLVWLRGRPNANGPVVATAPAPEQPGAISADRAYDSEVADLQRVVRARLTLDPHVVEVLRRAAALAAEGAD